MLMIALFTSAAAAATATPREDLASSLQEARDAAARELRASFVAPPRSKWEFLVAAIKPGDTKQSVMEILRPYNVTTESGVASGQTSTENYRLDDAWVLFCSYQRSPTAETIMEVTLRENLRHIWVAPAQTFSGVWTVYFVNGQRSHEINYADGRYFGEFTAFRSDGSKLYVQHYGPSGIDGEDTGYFPSGRVMYRAFYKKGTAVGTWTHYNEDGSVRSTTEHSEPNK
jgi:hypothetical protein